MPAAAARVSRGRLVTALAAGRRRPDGDALRAAGLTTYAPFRLLVIGRTRTPVVYTWNGERLTSRALDARTGFLTSSSWNSRRVIAARQARFRGFLRAHPTPSGADLAALHAETDAARGTPWAISMSRDDARTVSLTIVQVGAAAATMIYRARAHQPPAGRTARATSVWMKSSPLNSKGSPSTVASA
jgi:hypothetical protein